MSKNTILTGGICFLLVFLLLHPAESLSCARAGMTLWLNTLIPTLLPFIILTGMLTHTGHIRKLLLPFESFFHIFPGVSIWGGYVFVLGMLCGYPLGAKLASDLYGLHKISKKEALYLTTFCNNPSPAFIITYLCKSCLKDTVPAGMVFASIFSANLICILFFRFFVYQNATISDSPGFSPEISSRKNILDFSIMNGFETITRLGGYILLFSLVFTCIRHYWPFSEQTSILFTSPIELTTGLQQIAHSRYSWRFRCISSITLTAFGGLCVMFQTKSVLENRLSLFPYVTSKCLNTSLVFLFLVLSDIV